MSKRNSKTPAIVVHTNEMPITQIFKKYVNVVGVHEFTNIQYLHYNIELYNLKLDSIENGTHNLFTSFDEDEIESAKEFFEDMYRKQILNNIANICNLYFSEN